MCSKGRTGEARWHKSFFREGGIMAERTAEQYTYQIAKIKFIVSPVYKGKEPGETMMDILLKLIKADVERV